MIHPLLVTVIGMDAVAALILLWAAVVALQVVAGWHPESADTGQLSLESRAESAFLVARFGFYALILSTVLLILGIANVLPAIVPGAMCGTGVLQAMGGTGGAALGFRLVAIAILFAWHVIDRIDRQSPLSPLALTAGRTLLLAVPFVLMGFSGTIKAVLHMDVLQTVDCCAAVYDRFPSIAGNAGSAGLPGSAWVGLMLVLGTALLLSAATGARSGSGLHPKAMRGAAALSLIWPPVAAITLVRVLAAYHYEVLYHHCPWCLFLPEHGFVGILLYGALAVVMLEGPTAWVAAGISHRFPAVREQAAGRAVSACRRLLLAVAVFAIGAGLPAIIWRLRHGVWMG